MAPGNNPPPLPPRPLSNLTPSSSRPVARLSPLVYSSARVSPSTPVVLEKKMGIFSRIKSCVENITEKMSPVGVYEIEPGVSITGRKTSLFLFLSVISSIMMAVIPILTDDTALYECIEDGDGEVCVITEGKNTGVYFFLAFYQYPWVIAVYMYTGLWTNASGISAKVCALHGDFFNKDGLSEWEKHDYIISLDYMCLIVAILGYMAFYHQTLCLCDGDSGYIIYVLFIVVVGITGFAGIIGYGVLIQYTASLDPGLRLKRMKKFFFFFETCSAGALYIGTYGIGGIFFMVIPILGYIESFGLLEVGPDKCCLVC